MSDLKNELGSFYPKLLRVAERLTRNRADAEDLVQDTFVKALEHLHRLQEPKTLSHWLYLILLRIHLNQRRHKQIEQEVLAQLQPSYPEHPEGVLIDLMAALEALPAKQRQAVLLTVTENEPVENLAARLGVSRENFRVMVSRARARLTDHMHC